jgi:hypothetical protein
MSGKSLPNITLKGAVRLLGSLLWEGNRPEDDGIKGEARKGWRDAHLDLATLRKIGGLPICYGRRSQSRSGQYTMVFAGRSLGTARVANLKRVLPIEGQAIPSAATAILKAEVVALAKAEGIWTTHNERHWTGWGLVALAISPHSAFQAQIRAMWQVEFKPQRPFDHAQFGMEVVDADGILKVKLPWTKRALKGVDFCLSTPTKPDSPLPTPKQVAEAARLGSYFERTASSGIVTVADKRIRRYLCG